METRKDKFKRLISIIFSDETESDRIALNARERMEAIKGTLSKLESKIEKDLHSK